ncbi:MAG: four helix bundle protein [Cyclobacteriaceae bacterium]|nr:four helix bundle protein [Cyclobacteriaceae bacterium SS2]
MATHKDLEIWKLSIDLVENIYGLTKQFPKEEMYGLTSQMRRASISIPSNISEGAARKGNNENIQFLYISLGSLSELDTQLIIAERLKYVEGTNLEKMNEDIIFLRRKLLNYIKYIKTLR